MTNKKTIKKELFCTFDQSYALEELGFTDPCLATINDINSLHLKGTRKPIYGGSQTTENVNCPLKSQVFEWFEREHKLFSEIHVDCTTYPKFCYNINKFIGNPKDLTAEEWGWEVGNYSYLFKNRHEAENECINKLIKLIKL
jgi:hypothetical protein